MLLRVIIALHVLCVVCPAMNIPVLRPDVEPNADESSTRFSTEETKAIAFLRRYGYLPQVRDLRHPITRTVFTNALNNYQTMANLPIQNRLDEATVTSMRRPRCGNADVVQTARMRRYVLLAPRWRKSNLTWRVSLYPDQPDLSRSIVDSALRKAMQMWSNVSQIDFVQISDDTRRSVDIDIRFEATEHFRKGVLAHATQYRSPAKIHFNGRFTWTVGVPESETDLVSVAAHEIGHVLGINDTSADENALMYKYARSQTTELGRDDILAAQKLYGKRESVSIPWESAEGDSQLLVKGREPPAYIPNTNNKSTCAVLVVDWEPGSIRAWIEVQNAMSMPKPLLGVTYSYMATRRNCTLIYCTRPEFDGICETLGPSKHLQLESHEKFEIGSLSCECK